MSKKDKRSTPVFHICLNDGCENTFFGVPNRRFCDPCLIVKKNERDRRFKENHPGYIAEYFRNRRLGKKPVKKRKSTKRYERKNTPKPDMWPCQNCGRISHNRINCPECQRLLSNQIAGDEYIFCDAGKNLAEQFEGKVR